jgi:hypothetical protein
MRLILQNVAKRDLLLYTNMPRRQMLGKCTGYGATAIDAAIRKNLLLKSLPLRDKIAMSTSVFNTKNVYILGQN